MAVNKTLLLLGSVTLLGGLIFVYKQTSLFKDSEVNILGIKKIGASWNNISVTPLIEIVNKSDLNLKLESLEAEAFTLDPTNQWTSVAKNADTVISTLAARSSTNIEPEIDIPIQNAGLQILSNLISGKEVIDVLVKIKAVVNGQTILAEEQTTIEI